MTDIPKAWKRRGLVVARTQDPKGNGVVGDPCIVWDGNILAWRMLLFVDPGGQGQVTCLRSDSHGIPEKWSPIEPLRYAEPLPQGRIYHKPYIVQDAHRPNQAAWINGEYWLLSVISSKTKEIYRARSSDLAGPWRWDPSPIIPVGGAGEFDEKHTDAVSGFYFPERNEVLYFYMGYPLQAQPRKISPYGSAQGVAVQRPDEATANKLGMFLPPSQKPGHWAGGYLGGFQILPGQNHRWIALLNASPTPPRPHDSSIAREEPAPSLGGWACCDEEWPVKNWRFMDEPIEHIEDIPAAALANEEGTNLWRHHALVLPSGEMAVFYNSGFYGREQLYLKTAVWNS